MTDTLLRDKLRRAWRFVVDDVWDIELSSLSVLRRFGVGAIRVVELVFRGFRDDKCPLHASALTFRTLMAIVPILAFSLALARGLGDAETAKQRIRGAVSEWTATFKSAEEDGAVGEAGPDAMADGEAGAEPEFRQSELATEIERMVDAGFERVEKISFTALGSVGLVLLLWMVIDVLGKVEGSFNNVWGVTTGRPLWRRFTDYLSVLFILPIMAGAATSLPVADFATRFLDESAAGVVHAFLRSGAIKVAAVVLMSTLCFAFVLIFMPNTKVKMVPGLAGGLVTALLFIGWLRVCAAVQVGAARYGKIYGSFAVVPIVLAWVYISWQIVLFGAEVAFAVQNWATYRMERGAHQASGRARIMLALAVVLEAGRAMLGRAPAFDVATYARERKVPVRFLNDVVDDLVETGLLGPLAGRDDAYVLLKAPRSLGVSVLIQGMLDCGVQPRAVGLLGIHPAVDEVVQNLSQGMDASFKGRTIGDLLDEEEGERATSSSS